MEKYCLIFVWELEHLGLQWNNAGFFRFCNISEHNIRLWTVYVLFNETFEKSENMSNFHNSNIGTVDHRQGLKVNNNLELTKETFCNFGTECSFKSMY